MSSTRRPWERAGKESTARAFVAGLKARSAPVTSTTAGAPTAAQPRNSSPPVNAAKATLALCRSPSASPPGRATDTKTEPLCGCTAEAGHRGDASGSVTGALQAQASCGCRACKGAASEAIRRGQATGARLLAPASTVREAEAKVGQPSPSTPAVGSCGVASARAVQVPYGPRAKARADWYDADEEERWKNLSRGLQGLRQLGLGYVANDTLLAAAREDPRTPFAPLYSLWAFDSLRMAGMDAEAVAAADSFEKQFGDRDLHGVPLIDHILSCKAESLRLLGDAQQAVHTMERLLKLQRSRGERSAVTWQQLGHIAQELGDVGRARRAYVEAARCPTDGGVEQIRELARRNALRLEMKTSEAVRESPEAVARELMLALRRKDDQALSRLASKTHFGFGSLGGHMHFTAPSVVLPGLVRDLRATPRLWGRPEALEGRGGKRYLMTLGWTGAVFLLQVGFQIVRVSGGWEWRGLVFGPATEGTRALQFAICGPGEPMENQPLAESIKAPWPAPLAFQAGGVAAFSSLETSEALSLATALTAVGVGCAASCTGALVGYPVCLAICLGIGLPVAAALNTAQFAGIRALRGDRSCGFGIGGLYYNQPTHTRRGLEEQFAVDFTRWEPSNGFAANLSAGTPVLACHYGVVSTRFQDLDARGSGVFGGNSVIHSFAGSWREERLGSRYNAQYLHFDGPSRLLVGIGSWVEQGFVLGFMDDTGTSSWDHLHFQIFDRTLPSDGAGGFEPLGRTTRPTPIDGPAGPQPLEGDGQSLPTNDGDCIISDNVIANPQALCLLMAREASNPFEAARMTLACHLGVPRDPQPPTADADLPAGRLGPDEVAPPAGGLPFPRPGP